LFSGGIQHPHGESASLTDKICILGLRLIVDLLGIVVFALCALGLFFVFYQGHEPVRQTVATVYWSIILIRVVAASARFAIAPRAPTLRLPPIGDAVAVTLYRRLVWISAAIVVAVLVLDLFEKLGMEEGLMLLTGRIVSFSVIAFVITIIWHDRKAIAGLIQSGSNPDAEPLSPVKRLLAANWHILAICYVAGVFTFGSIQTLLTGERVTGPGVASVVVLLAIPFVDWIMQAGLKRLLRAPERPAEESSREKPIEEDEVLDAEIEAKSDQAESEYFPVLLRNLRIILAIAAAVILAKVWNIDLGGMAAVGMGEKVTSAIFDIFITVVLASAIWGIVKTAIGQKIGTPATDAEAMEGGDPGGAGKTRLETLLPLFQKFLFITLLVIVTLIVLSELGVDIGPLIAGAGIVGIAIGFGAQTLVRDIVSGVFFLIEDAFRVGEYIDIGGGIRGMVEDISIRSFRLRHHNGPIHTVPFGGVKTLTNFSRDWVIMKLEMRLPFETDIEQVRKIVKKVGVELMNDPVNGPNFLQPLKSQGVNRMDDSAFIFRMKFMAKPGEQFLLRREVYRRVQEALAAQDIHFAPKRVIVDTSGMTPEQAAAASRAAAAAAEDEAAHGGKADAP
jgi:small-conductance mechanosensitive channel